MNRFLADENLDRSIVEGLRALLPPSTLVTVREIGRSGAGDDELLEWAAERDLVLVTHDRRLSGWALARVRQGEPMAGVVIVPGTKKFAVGQAIEELELIALYELAERLRDRVRYLPLRD